MSKARDDVMRMIAKKQKKSAASRASNAQKIGPNGIVTQFINAMEAARASCSTSIEFDDVLTREARIMWSNMSSIDAGVHVEIIWAENTESDWKNINVDGVRIVWGDTHLNVFPQKSKELYIDIGSLFLEGYLDT